MMLDPRPHRSRGAFTLVELVVAMGVFTILGMVFFNVLSSGVVLFAKNAAVNAAHEEARQGLNRLTRDIHASVSVPQLRTASHAVLSSRPTAGVAPTSEGVSFQVVVSGPSFVWKDPTNSALIMVADQGTPPVPGQRMLVPFFNVEGDISKVTGAGTAAHSNIWLANGRETFIASQGPPYKDSGSYTPSTVFAIVYYTERMMYVVEGGSYVADANGSWVQGPGGTYVPAGSYSASTSGSFVLSRGIFKPWSTGVSGTRYNYVAASSGQRFRYDNGKLNLYRQRYTTPQNGNGTAFWEHVATVANHVSSPKPFYVPVSATGALDTRYVGVNLSTRDPKTTNRNYTSTAALLDTEIDYRSRIALYQ
jgi:type II secretory pathway pseudopilin PulG